MINIEIKEAPPSSPRHNNSVKYQWLVRNSQGKIIAGGTHWQVSRRQLVEWIEQHW